MSYRVDNVCELMVQHEIERGFIGMVGNASVLKEQVTMRSFPYDDQLTEVFTHVLIIVLPILLVFSMFSVVAGIVKVKYSVTNCYIQKINTIYIQGNLV